MLKNQKITDPNFRLILKLDIGTSNDRNKDIRDSRGKKKSIKQNLKKKLKRDFDVPHDGNLVI